MENCPYTYKANYEVVGGLASYAIIKLRAQKESEKDQRKAVCQITHVSTTWHNYICPSLQYNMEINILDISIQPHAQAQRIIQGVIFLSNKENNFSLCVKKVPNLRMVTARCHP